MVYNTKIVLLHAVLQRRYSYSVCKRGGTLTQCLNEEVLLFSA